MTLNQLADSIVNYLNQPFNHELRERVKDLFKEKMAVWIRRSFKEHGIDDILLLSYTSKLIRVNAYDKVITEDEQFKDIKDTKKRTEYRVPKPVRFKSDSPFTFVGTIDRKISLALRNVVEHQYITSYSSTWGSYSYNIVNSYIYINELDTSFSPDYILIESVFENPEEVISIYEDVDGQDVTIPIPADLIAMFRRDILEEFGVIRQTDIKVEHSDIPKQNE